MILFKKSQDTSKFPELSKDTIVKPIREARQRDLKLKTTGLFHSHLTRLKLSNTLSEIELVDTLWKTTLGDIQKDFQVGQKYLSQLLQHHIIILNNLLRGKRGKVLNYIHFDFVKVYDKFVHGIISLRFPTQQEPICCWKWFSLCKFPSNKWYAQEIVVRL